MWHEDVKGAVSGGGGAGSAEFVHGVRQADLKNGGFRSENVGFPHSGGGRVHSSTLAGTVPRSGRRGARAVVGRSGGRIRVVVCGAVAGNGTRLMRTYGTFNATNFVRYIGAGAREAGQDPADHGQRAAAQVGEGAQVPGAGPGCHAAVPAGG